jgi:chaperonin GroES
MLQPVGNHVLVQPFSKEEVTKSGIVLAESAQQKPQEGTVVAVGHGKYVGETLVTFEQMGVTKGATIMFNNKGYAGPSEIKVDGEDYYILDMDDILGVIS